ncbi:putative F-box domain-containing protein [Helianthus annuus]|nr:putative F-box domain-containing protein [Helianthus annuus]
MADQGDFVNHSQITQFPPLHLLPYLAVKEIFGIAAAAIDIIGEDLLQSIVSRLPATSFASAACVSRSWNLLCERVLSRPKLSSACSVNPSLQEAVEEVVNKVLSEPIRPHFAIASIAGLFGFDLDEDEEDVLEEARHLISRKLGSQVPVITNDASSFGLIGRDALSDEFKEIPFKLDDGADIIMLTVGYLPGMKVTAIPLLEQNKEPEMFMIDKFVTDIREFSTSVSGRNSPAAIIMYWDNYYIGMMDVVEKMDCALPPETVIAGDLFSEFRYTNETDNAFAAVALVFAVDMNKPPGIGETQFHAVVSSGLSPVGPTYTTASVNENINNAPLIAARREGSHENIDGQIVLNQVYDELRRDRIQSRELYIGVRKRRKYSIGQENVGCMTSLAFHRVVESRQQRLLVFGEGIKIGDTFRFYYPDSTAAISSVAAVSSHLRSFNRGSNNATGGDKQDVFGGLIFSCCDEEFFGQPNINISPFVDNFPGVTLGGTFCSGVFGRGVLTPCVKESQEQKAVQCCMHTKGVVYLIMSYTPSKRI